MAEMGKSPFLRIFFITQASEFIWGLLVQDEIHTPDIYVLKNLTCFKFMVYLNWIFPQRKYFCNHKD